MGKRGPKKTPTAILQRRGSWRGDSRDGEPAAEIGQPAMPSWVTDDAVAVWSQVCSHLSSLGVLATTDGNAIGRYCVLLVRWVSAVRFLEKYGESYPVTSRSGDSVTTVFRQFPQAATATKLATLLLRLEQEFGMTPASRANISVPHTEAPDDKARFFKVTG